MTREKKESSRHSKSGYKLFSDLSMPKKIYSQGEIIRMQILKKCNVDHPMYGEIVVNQKYFDNVITNFDNKIPKEDLAVNKEHERTEAQARFKDVIQEGGKLYADLELTKNGAENINGGHYKYFSIEVYDKYIDPDTKTKYDNVLVGGAFTNYPFFRGMEKAFSDPTDKTENIYLSFKNPISMEKIKELLAKFKEAKKLDFASKKELILAFSELNPDEAKEVEKEVTDAVETVEVKEEKKEEEKKEEKEEKEEEKKEEEKQEHSQPNEVEAMKAELATLRAERRFSQVKDKFQAIDLLGNAENFSDVVKVFSNLSDEQNDNLFKFFSNINNVVNTLTQGQISKEYARKDTGEKEKKMKDGKEVISEGEMNKKVANYAEKNGCNPTKAYEAIKEKYTIE